MAESFSYVLILRDCGSDASKHGAVSIEILVSSLVCLDVVPQTLWLSLLQVAPH